MASSPSDQPWWLEVASRKPNVAYRFRDGWAAASFFTAEVAEMMRLLVDVMQVAWDEAWDLCTKCALVCMKTRGKLVGRLLFPP